MLAQLPGFLAISGVVIVTPGPDTALTIRNALIGGRHSGIITALGVAAGQAVWALLTACGVASLLQASQPAILGLRIAGAGYLIYLGGHALLAASRVNPAGTTTTPPARITVRPTTALRQGLVSNLANPKMAIFFLSLFPQFTGGHPALTTVLGLGLTFPALTFLWLSGYAMVIAKAGDVLRRQRARRIIDAAAGTVLIALGLRVLTEASR